MTSRLDYCNAIMGGCYYGISVHT